MKKIVVVTGAGQGLGYHIVRCHADLHDTVYALDCNITTEIESLAKEYSSLKVYQCDVSSDKEVEESLKDVLREGKQVDVIYNVAGIAKAGGRAGIDKTNMDDCLEMYNVNALGALRVCRVLWPLIEKGSLVMNISSEAGSIGAARRSAMYGYCMSKAAMNMGSKILSNQLWEKDARVMCIYPGWLKTKMGGPEALRSSKSVLPEESAKNIVEIVGNIDSIPRDQMFMSHIGDILPW
ncbi:MAG: SDR family oxidoreductase [Treponema sp.]|jgi:NAD(P)-dependent dehydrogenase (short-subunit alcohol dehydrogenase family)|nr:SDR family oxidoreductase [Treponema sp.]